MIFTLMLQFILSFNNAGLTATAPGYYAEVINVTQDAQANTTYGDLVRYDVAPDGAISRHFQQVRSCPGKCVAHDIAKAVVADSNITVLGK